MTVEDKLKELILSRYRTMKDFADACGVKYTTVMSIVQRGVNSASVSNIVAICRTLGISADAIAEGEIMTLQRRQETTSIEMLLVSLRQHMADRDLTYEDTPLSESEYVFLQDSTAVILSLLKVRRDRERQAG